MIALSRGLFASLQKHRVKYVVIGGVAVVLHGVPRMTGDIDLFILVSKADLIAAKRAAGRPRDLEDVAALQVVGKD